MTGELIDKFAQGSTRLSSAIEGMSREQLMATPVPGKWSTHQVVIHLADAELAFADRIKRIIAMENPTLLAWDENKFSANLHYEKQSTEDAVLLVQITRRQLTRVLRELPDAALQRSGTHSERGPQTLAVVLGFANSHLDHHLKFVEEKRAALKSHE